MNQAKVTFFVYIIWSIVACFNFYIVIIERYTRILMFDVNKKFVWLIDLLVFEDLVGLMLLNVFMHLLYGPYEYRCIWTK